MRFNAMHSVFRNAAAAIAIALPSLSVAQPARTAPTIIERPGNTIEVVGLRRWTVAMIQDSLAKYSPGDSLHSDGCAAVLRYTLGFADAAVTWYQLRPGQTHTLIVLREPQDSALVRYRPASFDTTGRLRRYRPLLALHLQDPRMFARALNVYPLHRAGRSASLGMMGNLDSMRVVWAELARHTSSSDRDRAIATLRSDRSMYNRAMAVAVLGNFAEHDATWHALLEAMLESDGMVKGMASNLARSMSAATPRTVDWTPRLRSIRSMLDGTALFNTGALLEVLVKTGISPAHAGAVLRGRDAIVFDLADVTLAPARYGARAFLTHMSGVDHGDDVDAWRRWADQLPQPTTGPATRR